VGGGTNNKAIFNYATVAGGNHNTANDSYATVSGGNQNSAQGNAAAVAGGFLNFANGDNSFAVGAQNVAEANGSVALGENAYANFEGQSAIASGPTASGAPLPTTCIQKSEIILRGQTPGSVAGETATLGYGATSPPSNLSLTLANGKVYNLIAECAVQIPFTLAGAHILKCVVRVFAGTATIAGTGMTETYGDAAYLASGSNLAFSVVSGTTIQLQWTSGFGTAVQATIVANVRMVEIATGV
jgi:hypothetical protein